MKDVDWLAVDMVCQGTKLALRTREKRMVVRRLRSRMLTLDDWYWSPATAAKLTAEDVAQRLGTTTRSVQRMAAELPNAAQTTCPVCRNTMWVLDDNTVEPHPDSLFRDCPMSGRTALRGLAAERPDLYLWVAS